VTVKGSWRDQKVRGLSVATVTPAEAVHAQY
jgi:hypothetical protein